MNIQIRCPNSICEIKMYILKPWSLYRQSYIKFNVIVFPKYLRTSSNRKSCYFGRKKLKLISTFILVDLPTVMWLVIFKKQDKTSIKWPDFYCYSHNVSSFQSSRLIQVFARVDNFLWISKLTNHFTRINVINVILKSSSILILNVQGNSIVGH